MGIWSLGAWFGPKDSSPFALARGRIVVYAAHYSHHEPFTPRGVHATKGLREFRRLLLRLSFVTLLLGLLAVPHLPIAMLGNAPQNVNAAMAHWATTSCTGIYSPGYYMNWQNHYTRNQFAALVAGTADFSTIGVSGAESILDNTAGDQAEYVRHLLTAELNVAGTPALGSASFN